MRRRCRFLGRHPGQASALRSLGRDDNLSAGSVGAWRGRRLVGAAASPVVTRGLDPRAHCAAARSEEHTSELQSLMRISYAVFCLKKKNHNILTHHTPTLLHLVWFSASSIILTIR